MRRFAFSVSAEDGLFWWILCCLFMTHTVSNGFAVLQAEFTSMSKNVHNDKNLSHFFFVIIIKVRNISEKSF